MHSETAVRIGERHLPSTLNGEQLLLLQVEHSRRRYDGIEYTSPEMGVALRDLERIAKRDVRVNIYGESGTGKERIARYIHDHSPRSHKNFVAVNCREQMGDLIRSEFFGHEKGAFTGAYTDKVGLLELADRGTLFFDEVDGTPRDMQEMLLRAEYGIRKVGGTKILTPNVRIITASKANLAYLVKEEKMESDFYFRIMGVDISLPPIRDRKGDIEYLADYFCRLFSNGNLEPDKSTIELMQKYQWPGNVRELQEVIRQAVTYKGTDKGYLHPDDIMRFMKFWNTTQSSATPKIAQFSFDISTIRPLKEIERELILTAWEFFGKNADDVAKAIGTSRRTVHRRLTEYGVLKPDGAPYRMGKGK